MGDVVGFLTKAPEPLPAQLDAVLTCSPDARKDLIGAVHKNLAGLQAVLGPGETVELLSFGDDINEIGVFTTERLFSLKKGKIRQGPFDWHQIDQVEAGRIPRNGGTEIVWLQTESFRLDYREDDGRRFSQVVTLTGRVPRDARNIIDCATRLRAMS